MVPMARVIERYEVTEVGDGAVVAAVDARGHRFLVCDCPDVLRAHFRAAHLSRKLRRPRAAAPRRESLYAALRHGH